MNLILLGLSLGGLLFHFLTRWGAHWRTIERVGPFTFAMEDLPGWLASLLAAVILIPLLQFLPVLLALPAELVDHVLMRALAFFVGYSGSSIAKKIPQFFSKRVER